MTREREALLQIGGILSRCLTEKKKPTVDEMMAMLSWTSVAWPSASSSRPSSNEAGG